MGREKKEKKEGSALSVSKGVDQPPSVNPDLVERIKGQKKKAISAEEYSARIFSARD